MPRSILDASAVLAILNREHGSDLIEEYLVEGIVSTVNLSEVAAKLCDRGVSTHEVLEILPDLGLEVRAFDEGQALAAETLRETTRSLGLSLGDRACLALGIAEGMPIVTTDRAWAAVPVGTSSEVVVVRQDRLPGRTC